MGSILVGLIFIQKKHFVFFTELFDGWRLQVASSLPNWRFVICRNIFPRSKMENRWSPHWKSSAFPNHALSFSIANSKIRKSATSLSIRFSLNPCNAWCITRSFSNVSTH